MLALAGEAAERAEASAQADDEQKPDDQRHDTEGDDEAAQVVRRDAATVVLHLCRRGAEIGLGERHNRDDARDCRDDPAHETRDKTSYRTRTDATTITRGEQPSGKEQREADE